MKETALFADFLQTLESDRSQGASELARRCLRRAQDSALGEFAAGGEELRQILLGQAGEMRRTRPSMAPIHNLLKRWELALRELPVADLARFRESAGQAAGRLVEVSQRAIAETAAAAAEFCGDGVTIITHSYSSTVLEVFRRLRGRRTKAIVSESRPLCEGQSLALRVAEWSLPVTLITDAQLGIFVAQADLALVGADSLLGDGSAVNKAGTYLLALAARDRGIPFYVCCESFKWLSGTSNPPVLEEMDAAELGWQMRLGILVRNVYFDITPAPLISGWFSETGLRTHWQGAG